MKYIIVLVVLILGAGALFFVSTLSEDEYFRGSQEEEEYGEDLGGSEGDLVDVIARSEGIDSLTYDFITTLPDRKMEGRFWLKGKMMRSDIVAEEGRSIILFDEEEKTITMYSPDFNIATKMALNEDDGALEANVKGRLATLLDYDPVVLGEEVVDGKKCMVVAYTQEEVEVKMWIWKEYGLPIKIEVPVEGGVSVYEITNIEFVDIENDFFELPEGVQVRSMM